MNQGYLECLAEISMKKYQDIVCYSLKLEARVAELTKKINNIEEENKSLVKKLETKNKRSSSTQSSKTSTGE